MKGGGAKPLNIRCGACMKAASVRYSSASRKPASRGNQAGPICNINVDMVETARPTRVSRLWDLTGRKKKHLGT